MSTLIDITHFNISIIPFIIALSLYNNILILLNIVFLVGLVFQYKKYLYKSWNNWFEIIKFLSGLISIIFISYCRFYQINMFYVTVLLLSINMLEAIISDLSTHGYFNAMSGYILINRIIYELEEIKTYNNVYNMFLFPISTKWIILYTTWNSAFSYGFNYSPSTRLMLLTSLFISIIIFNNEQTWLAIRTYTLMINMLLRLTQPSYFYRSGESYITNNYYKHNTLIRHVWGFVNLLACIYL